MNQSVNPHPSYKGPCCSTFIHPKRELNYQENENTTDYFRHFITWIRDANYKYVSISICKVELFIPLSKDNLYQVWLNLALWFWRRKIFSVLLLFCYYLPWRRASPFILTDWNPLSSRMVAHVVQWLKRRLKDLVRIPHWDHVGVGPSGETI
jgi:hypothetical protein